MSKIVSIITVVRNDKEGLIKTYESIKDSLCDKIEWVVVDGNSNDGTKDFLNSRNFDFTKWVSESDKNMYDAMNKGIKMASGNYLQFLNAGDILMLNLNKLNLEREIADLIFYNIQKIEVSGIVLPWSLPDNFLSHLPKYPSIPHQGTFIKSELFDRIGMYSEDYKYLGDYDFFCRVVNNSSFIPSYSYKTDKTLVSFLCNGVTFNYRLSLKLMNECIKVQKQYYNSVNRNMMIMYFSKYILSYIPNHLEISKYMRRYIKH